MCTSLACPDYYGASAPSRAIGRRRVYPTGPGRIPGRGNDTGWFPCSLRIDRSAWHPALPRQHRHGYAADLHRDLPTGTPSRLTESATHTGWPCTAPRPISTRFEPVPRLRSFTTGSSRIPSDLARRTRPVWQYQTVPALSALLPALPGVSRIRLRSAPARLLRQPGEEVSHLLRFPAPHGAPAPRGALDVLPPHLPPRQAQHRHGTGDNEEDQLQARKPESIARQPACERATNRHARPLTLRPPRRIRPGDMGFRHPQDFTHTAFCEECPARAGIRLAGKSTSVWSVIPPACAGPG